MKRIKYIDQVKGFAILLIVLGHIIPASFLKTWIYTFHVPIFFIINGILIAKKEKSAKDINVKECFFNILYPYFTFSIFVLIKDFLKCILIERRIISGLIVNDFIKFFLFEGYGTLWFLPVMFFAEVLFIEIFKNSNYKTTKYILKMTILLLIILLLNKLSIFKYFTKIFISLFFLAVGYLLERTKNLFQKKINIEILLLILLAFMPFSILNGKVDMHYCIYNNLLLYVIISLINSILIILIFKNLKLNSKVLEFFGKNSLIIMITHSVLPVVSICSFAKKIFDNLIISNALTFIFTLIFEVAIIFFTNKYFKFMFSIHKKRKEV